MVFVSRGLWLTVAVLPAVFASASFVPPADDGSKDNTLIRAGDHISIIGNTLADRMQHDGWLDTYLHARFPKYDLSIRNFGFAADEVTVRLRSANFGSPDHWLGLTRSDVVFAFFGYNESFGGEAGLPKFKNDLAAFVQHTLKQKYNGTAPPRLVLFSPIAHEDLHDPNLPDGRANNKRLALYAAAMAEIARANAVPFVDLFDASLQLYAASKEPLTINGVHLNEHGNRLIAQVMDQALFPGQPLQVNKDMLEKIRQAVLDKNFHWFNRYRTVDGYSIYGGRSTLKFVGGQTNLEVMQREMAILDVMTTNRDKRIWAVAASGGKVLPPADDSNLPPFVPVQTNKPGPLPGGKHLFLDGEEAIKTMTLAKGYHINLFASEKEFPELTNPVQMAFDPQGRLWVAVWPTYPHWKPTEPMNDKLIIFEDTDGDGRADKKTVFADSLHCPTGFDFYNGGVLVAQAPDLVFLKDTDGDGKADFRRRVLHGLDSADTHHTANSFVLDPGGALYFQEGTFHRTQVETPWGPPQRCADAGVFRYEPRTQKFDVYVNFGFANPHGHVFDRWGQDVVVDGTGAVPYHATLFSGKTDYPQRHARPPSLYKQKTRPCPGMEILSSRHFPEANQGNLLVANVIGFLGILQYKFQDKGASFEGIEVEPILSATDPNFRPADMKIGPDGALYFIDWQNPIIGHMQHNLRDPSRDREHGRIYRITYPSRPLLKPVRIAGEPIEKLLDLLKEPEDRVRYRARIELGGRDTDKVVAALQKWIPSLDKKDPEYEHHMMEALWQYQYQNVVDENLLKRMLRSADFHARAAATRVLCYWRDRVKNPLGLLQTQINDEHPRVRLEAIRALSFFPLAPPGKGEGERALGIAVELFAHADDEYLRFVFNETLNTLEKRLGGATLDRKNIAAGILNLLNKGTVSAAVRPALIETICRHGGPKELKAIWDKLLTTEYPGELRRQVLEWLADAAIVRRVQPPVDAQAVAALLAESAKDSALYPEAIQLVAAWKVKEAGPELRRISGSGKASLAARKAALDGLAALGESENLKTLRDLAGQAQPMELRFHAAIALAQVDLDGGANAAAKALAGAGETADPAAIVEAFLVRKHGPEKLAAAMLGEKISGDTAKRILHAMFLAGSNDPALGGAASKLAGLDAAPQPPSPQEIQQIASDVKTSGDPARGEKVFRRADLGCVKCHAVNKAGGNIGPDLGPLGGSSPVDYIIAAILDPSSAIKEEYLTKVIVTGTGRVVTGVVALRNKNEVVLKDATGKLVRIPAADIDEEANGKSLMPEGITRILTRAELIDLIRFISELGKPGPYGPRKSTTIQTWKMLRHVPTALLEGIPNRDVLRGSLLQTIPESWAPVFAMVDGNLPLDELRKPGLPQVLYLQAEINVVQGGPLEFLVDAQQTATFWIDEEPFEKQVKATVTLPPGRHRLTIRALAQGGLRVELRKPADARTHFELVQAE